MRKTAAAVVIMIAAALVDKSTYGERFQKEEGMPARVSITSSSQFPGNEVILQVELNTVEEVNVGRVLLSLTLPRHLSLVRVEKTSLADLVGAELQSQPGVDAEDAETTLLQLILSTLNGEKASRQAILNGPMVDLVFKISEKAQPKSDLLIKYQGQVTRMDEPAADIPIPPEVAKVSVYAPGSVIISCFFYMH
ncbi:MAG: hypothetical protein HY645_12510 [Acidobacteria bacterium]|nr:hypothetical protein [Acidobacteriota bacterium]